MTTTLVEARRAARHRRALAYWLVGIAWLVSLGLGAALSLPRWMHMIALVVHLASVIVGLGAALMIEYQGMLWTAGRQGVSDLVRVERFTSPVTWLGIVGLFASGALLHPNLTSPLTAVKLGAVLLVALNGVSITRLTRELARVPASASFRSLPVNLRVWCVGSAGISQLGWWTAVILGLLNTASR